MAMDEIKRKLVDADCRYRNAVQNLRGTMQRKQSSLHTKGGRDPSKVETYRILGNAALDETKGIAAVQTVKGSPEVDKCALECLSALVDLTHVQLLHHHAHGHSLSYKEVEQSAGNSEVPSSGCSGNTGSENRKGKITRLVTGMSGGADSTLALLLSCEMRKRYGYAVTAVHCIHRLDPDDDIWLSNNVAVCEQLGVELKTPVLDIVYGNGVSPEEVSRNERYRELTTEASDAHAALVFGHQADDQTESFLLALKRGSGPQGLGGMSFVREDERGLIIRPLLLLHKIELEQILVSSGIPYVYDLSNSYLKFERNFMRLRVIPLLRSRFAGVDKAILRSQALCSAEHDLAERYAESLLPNFLRHCNEYPHLCFDYASLDLTDRNLCVMLLRSFFRRSLAISVELNIIEQCLELMARPNDSNGLIKLNTNGPHCSPLLLSTFAQKLYVFERSDESMTGRHKLFINQILTIGAYSYSLSDAYGQASNPSIGDSNDAPVSIELLVPPSIDSVDLNFDYTGSLKLKPTARRHSREVKKLFTEYGIPPWQRKRQPLISFAHAQPLSLGTICPLEPTTASTQAASISAKAYASAAKDSSTSASSAMTASDGATASSAITTSDCATASACIAASNSASASSCMATAVGASVSTAASFTAATGTDSGANTSGCQSTSTAEHSGVVESTLNKGRSATSLRRVVLKIERV